MFNYFDPDNTSTTKEDDDPGARLNFILFDNDYNVLDMGYQLSTGYNSLQKISIPTVNVTEPGFIFVYLSYESESNNYVQFDDMKVTHTKTNVIQYNEYYAFGLQAATSWTREGSKNEFLYNEGNQLNASTGWYDMFFRNYDPVTGRMMQVDPYATSYASHSVYNYAMNNPVMMNDPNGAQAQAPGGVSQMGYNRMNRIAGMSNSGDYYADWGEDFSFYAATGGADIEASLSSASFSVGYYTYSSIDGGKTWVQGLYTEVATIEVEPENDCCGWQTDIPVWGSAVNADIAAQEGRYVDAAAWTTWGVIEISGVGALYKAVASQGGKYFASFFARKAASKSTVTNIIDDLVRVRHHTSSEGLQGIRKVGSINASRTPPFGVDVEVPPFLPPSQVNLGQAGRGAFVEFSILRDQLSASPGGYLGGTGNAARIVTGGTPLSIQSAAPKFVRWDWWPF